MKKAAFVLLVPAAILAGDAQTARAQGITITPALGAFIPASELRELQEQAEQRRLDRSATLGLGLNVELGWLRGSLAYATGATLTDRGVTDAGDVGDGSVLALAADVVWRPLPRLLVQPYLLGGGGIKRQDYSYDDEGLEDVFPDDKTDFTLHFGVGADAWLGGIGVMAEVTDFLSRRGDDTFGQHDAFILVGLKFRLGGGD
jgi:hypothetical protein